MLPLYFAIAKRIDRGIGKIMEHPNTYNCVQICRKCNEFILEGISKNLPNDQYCGLPPHKVHVDCENAVILKIKNSEDESEEKRSWKEKIRSSFLKFTKRYFWRK